MVMKDAEHIAQKSKEAFDGMCRDIAPGSVSVCVPLDPELGFLRTPCATCP